jgi:aminoglycoside phosphotransferase (APT) family kinase protein
VLPRCSWIDLDARLRKEIEGRTDVVVEERVHEGDTGSDLLVTLRLASRRRVVVKGVRYPPVLPSDSRAVGLVKEAMVLRCLPFALAPELLHIVDFAGWLVLVLDYIPGNSADLAPASPDVDRVARTLATLAARPAVARSVVRSVPSLAYGVLEFRPWRLLWHLRPRLHQWVFARLDEWAAVELEMIRLCEGDALMHSDIRRADLMVTQRAVSVLDWSSARLAPPWVDLATFAALLVEHGHEPVVAQDMVAPASAWVGADPSAVTAHAVLMYGMWEWRRYTSTARGRAVNAAKADAWLRWAYHRWTRYPLKVR